MVEPAKVLLTGGSGFIGQHLLAHLQNKGAATTLVGRSAPQGFKGQFIEADLSRPVSLTAEHWREVDVVIHLAAKTNSTQIHSAYAQANYLESNTQTTISLAEQAASAGVKRFIFLSSVKVNGEQTLPGRAFTESDLPAPEDDYAKSKLLAEEALLKIARDSSMSVVIIRPPLVYGPGVKANFLRLLKLANSPLPLPFGAVKNNRSMLFVGNLVDLIYHCAGHPSTANQTYLVADQTASVPETLKLLRTAMGRSGRMLPVPQSWLITLARLFGKQAVIERLLGSLEVDGSSALEQLGWKPPYSVDQAIELTVKWYLEQEKNRNV